MINGFNMGENKHSGNINGMKAMDAVAHDIENFVPYYMYVKTSAHQLKLIGIDDTSIIGSKVLVTYNYDNGYCEIECKNEFGAKTKVSVLKICLVKKLPLNYVCEDVDKKSVLKEHILCAYGCQPILDVNEDGMGLNRDRHPDAGWGELRRTKIENNDSVYLTKLTDKLKLTLIEDVAYAYGQDSILFTEKLKEHGLLCK